MITQDHTASAVSDKTPPWAGRFFPAPGVEKAEHEYLDLVGLE
jgi:hypothetical protein